MTVDSISAASLSQYVLAAGNFSQLQETMQSLQNSLGSGDLEGAQSAYQTLQTLSQKVATANSSTLSSNSQFSTDLTALGTALTSGDLTTAHSAFATVQNDVKGLAPAQSSAQTAAAQSVELVDELLGTLSPHTSTLLGANSSTSDLSNSILEDVYGTKSSLNVFA